MRFSERKPMRTDSVPFPFPFASSFLPVHLLAPLLVLAVACPGCGAPQAQPAPVPPPVEIRAAPPSLPPAWPYRVPVVVHGTRGMVVTDNAVASKVGADV